MVLADEPADAGVVVAVAHQDQPGVCVRLAPVPPAIPEHTAAPCLRRQRAEARGVLVVALALGTAVNGPQVAHLVVGIVAGRVVAVLRQPRRVDRRAVVAVGGGVVALVDALHVACRVIRVRQGVLLGAVGPPVADARLLIAGVVAIQLVVALRLGQRAVGRVVGERGRAVGRRLQLGQAPAGVALMLGWCQVFCLAESFFAVEAV